jgi:hypothetical protein
MATTTSCTSARACQEVKQPLTVISDPEFLSLGTLIQQHEEAARRAERYRRTAINLFQSRRGQAVIRSLCRQCVVAARVEETTARAWRQSAIDRVEECFIRS